MIDRKEIAARVIIFSTVYILVAAVAVFYFGREWLLIPIVFVVVLWGLYVYRMNVRVLGMPVQTLGVEGLEGRALTDIHEEGKVKVRGEIWSARSAQKIEKGKKVRILNRNGIVIEVEPVED